MGKKLVEPGSPEGYLQLIPLSQVCSSGQAILHTILASSLLIPDAVNRVIQRGANNMDTDG